MLSIEACVKILNNNGKKRYNSEEAKAIREYLYQIAKIQEYKNKKNNNYEDFNIL